MFEKNHLKSVLGSIRTQILKFEHVYSNVTLGCSSYLFEKLLGFERLREQSKIHVVLATDDRTVERIVDDLTAAVPF